MILLTGAAGFIGFHTAKALLDAGQEVVGVDNLNDYYDVALKKARIHTLDGRDGWHFVKADIADERALRMVLAEYPQIDRIVHLAAQAGVRYSLTQPYAYGHSNLDGHLTMLEVARHMGDGLRHFVYASSSSVYGGNTKLPFSVGDQVDTPLSLYAATKRAAELLTQSYAHLYRIPATGLRFFTVYGPWGRPDMAVYSFTEAMARGQPITVYNDGHMKRDFTYIDDIVAGILGALEAVPKAGDRYCIGDAPHRIFNLGNNRSEALADLIASIEAALGIDADRVFAPLQPGDVLETYADIGPAREVFGFSPATPISQGIPLFVAWYRAYRGL
ncbi:MAG: NAD-dependent epimerase/dehydratase family protein [Rhodospirillales bacterium]|nr:NAD-dependent epimerase/dehydratase family protein [Rhodospirillales bacterium]